MSAPSTAADLRQAPAGTRPPAGPARGAERTGTLLTIAPGHFVYDERVVRTVAAGRGFARSVYAVDHDLYEQMRRDDPRLAERAADRLGAGVEVVLLPRWKRVRGLARATRHLYAYQIARQARDIGPDVVHVHEAGLLGVLVAWWVRRLVPRCRIIFDYHDWIPFEIAGLVRDSRPAYAAYTAAAMPVLRRLARAVDTAVCISPGHAEWTRRELGILDTVVVQNVRPAAPSPTPLPEGGVRRELVFVGNVMRIRRLELVVDVLAELRARGVEALFRVFGTVMEADYADEVRAYARDRGVEEAVVFHGRYMGDAELAAHVGRGSLGVVLALDDRLGTGINRIASANKFFSCLALGMPALVEAPYENMVALAEGAGAGRAFGSAASCADAALDAWKTPGAWERMREGALALASEMNADAYRPLLERLYGGGR